MSLLEICKECETILESTMAEIKTEKVHDHPIFIHLDYCPKCNEYKGYSENFSLEKEKEAILEKFNHMYKPVYRKLGKITNYKTIIPVKKKILTNK